MSVATTSAWARRFVTVGVLYLLAFQVAWTLGAARRTAVYLGVLGFVLHVVFGKAYALVPAYFARELATPRLQPVHLALTTPGVALLAADAEWGVPLTGAVGSALWALGVVAFLGVLALTLRGNLTGRETGTSDANEEREPTDRLANAFVPVALAYLAVGSYALLALHVPLPNLLDGYAARVSHLLAAGAAATLLFAVGFRLLPRFLVAHPPRSLVALVLSAGALGPALVAATLGDDLRAGAVVQTIAVVGFAAAYALLFARSDRRRVGLYGVLVGAACGVLGVLVGLSFAFGGLVPGLLAAHFRLNVLGFLGLTIVGVSYQFYPPAVGSFRGASDRTALATIAALGGGLLVEVAGLALGSPLSVAAGRLLSLVGAVAYAYLLFGLFAERYG